MMRILVVGAGASGLAAAISAARNGASVTILEKMSRPGLRLLASGGGHCNLANTASPKTLPSLFQGDGATKFCRHALGRLPSSELIRFFASIGVRICSPDGFHLYPESRRATDVLNALLLETRRLGVKICLSTEVKSLIFTDSRQIAGVAISDGHEIDAEKIIIACGGKSYPSLGGGESALALAKSAGHASAPFLPALSEIHVSENPFRTISGVSLENASLSLICGGSTRRFHGELLFTHKGLSGKCALDASGAISREIHAKGRSEFFLSFVSDMNAEAWNSKITEWRSSDGSKRTCKMLSGILTASLSRLVCEKSNVPETMLLSQMGRDDSKRISMTLSGMRLESTDLPPIGKSMLSCGGISLEEVFSETLESRLRKNLYFAGEALDIDGPCGGYNLHWAFASGLLAGTAASSDGQPGEYGHLRPTEPIQRP